MMRRQPLNVEKVGVGCNDRKVDTMTIQAYEKSPDPTKSSTWVENTCCRTKTLQVYAVPNGIRGAETKHFKVVVNGVAVEDTDIVRLREKATKVFQALSEDAYEKVIVVQTSGGKSFGHQTEGQTFGVSWRLGWRVTELGITFDDDRRYPIDIRNDRPEDHQHEIAGVKLAGRDDPNTIAVLPWTQAREDVLKATAKAIVALRDELNSKLEHPEVFAGLLDAKAGLLLTEGKPT